MHVVVVESWELDDESFGCWEASDDCVGHGQAFGCRVGFSETKMTSRCEELCEGALKVGQRRKGVREGVDGVGLRGAWLYVLWLWGEGRCVKARFEKALKSKAFDDSQYDCLLLLTHSFKSHRTSCDGRRRVTQPSEYRLPLVK
jgi:hypothetical protein